ncbi:MAG: PAS domain S-box protein [Caulobacterales bacterium]|nr:PAS domain S-box protein [Caulobacterales bacterium]
MARTAPSDFARLAEIRSLDLRALRPVIDRIARLARGVSGADHAYVVLVEEDHVWMSGFDGAPERFDDHGNSTTARHLDSTDPLWIRNTADTWPDHDWVTGPPFVRAYANAPLMVGEGIKIGALCLAFAEPRDRDDRIIAALTDLAALLAGAIDRLRTERAAEIVEREARVATSIKQAIMRSAPMTLSMTDRDLRFLYVNDSWSRDTGVPREEALGRTVQELFPGWIERYGETYLKALGGESVQNSRLRVSAPDGADLWLSAQVGPWRSETGEVGGLVFMSHDITELIASLERAERSERRLKLALEIADVLVYEVDYRDKTLKVDGATDTFFGGGLTYEDVASDIWVTVHPDDREAAKACWEQSLTAGTPFRTEYRMNPADGREVWAFSAAELIKDEQGRITGVLGVLKNITSRKHVEEATARARDLAEAANRAKSEFLANMSHEIRTPLNGVMGVASALSRTDLTPAQVEMVGLIETSGQTLEAILADVLDLARIESGRVELKPEQFDLAACLRSAAALFRPGAREKGLGFDLAIDRSVFGAFVGDAVRLRQILCNLLSNAVKFTAHGRITLEATTADDGRLSITVSDTGIGFDAEVKDRLFERFEQADGSITRRFGGTGLGLAISRALAEAMDGVLEAWSEPGAGSRFTLTLPLDRWSAPLADAAPLVSAEPGDIRAPRVLLAEDHAINRKVVELLFSDSDVELTCVENGAEAVEAAAVSSFDLILMDMQMPVMDGLTAIRAIRAAESAGRRYPVSIWALSANALPEHVAASMAAGADGHLSKPITAQALFATLAEAFAERMPETLGASA